MSRKALALLIIVIGVLSLGVGLNSQQTGRLFPGSNPYVDVTVFGARAVNPNIAPATDGVTASITSGTPTATLNGASSFINGDGVVIREAGATNTLATPGAPTVQSVLMSGPLGTVEIAAANAGGTTYSYKIVARTQLGGLTAAGPAGTTVTGLASLGIITATVANSSLSGTTVTVNTSAATDLVPKAIVWVPQSGNVPGALIYKVGTTPSNTQFTFSQQGSDSLGSGPSIGAGSINYINCNHLTWTAVPNAYQYYIYLSGTLIDRTRPGENFYDDCGATIRGTPNIPTYVPASAPGAATNDPLVTTIISGAGTTTLTLAANASNTVATKTIRIDSTPGLRAAYLAGGPGTPIYLPTSSLGNFFVTNSFLDWSSLGSGTNIQQAGALQLNETVQLNRATYWEGTRGGGSFNNNNAFAWDQYRSITTRSAYPGIYLIDGDSNTFVGVSFNNTDDNALDLLMDGGFNAHFNRCYFNTGKSGGGFIDYLGIGAMFRGVTNVTLDHVTLNTGMANNLAMGPWAGEVTFRSDLALANSSNDIQLNYVFTAAKNIVDDHNINFSDMHGDINNLYTQGARTPIVTLVSNSSIPGEWTIKGVACDTTGVPIFTNLTDTQFLVLGVSNISGASPGCQSVSGNVINNFSASTGGVNPPFYSGVSASAWTATNLGNARGQTFSDRTVTVFGAGAFKHAIGTIPAPPVIVVQAGGTLSVGTHTYQYHYYDIDGNAGPLSAIVNGVTTPGNQQVQITVGTPPVGMIGYYVYRDGGRLQFGAPWFCAPLISQGLTLIDPNGVNCGNSPFVSGGAGDAGIRSGNIFSPSYTLIDPNNSGFTQSTNVPAPLTANRLVKYPDATGFAPLLPTAATTETGSGAVVRAVSPALTGTPTVNGVAIAGVFTAINITPVTLPGTSTTNPQNLMAVTIPAGTLNSASRTLLVQLAGVYTTAAASTTAITHRLVLCTVSGCGSGTVLVLTTWTTPALGAISPVNNPYNVTSNFSTQTTGGSAAFEAHGNLAIDLSALTTAAESVFADNNTATVGTIDSTVQLFLQHQIAFTIASASNVATDRQLITDTVD